MKTNVFKAVQVRRTTAETDFAVRLAPRTAGAPLLDVPNRLLSHFLDHFAKASGIAVSMDATTWPRSWAFDHVLCEDLGQLIGRGVAAIAAERTAAGGIAGRASASSGMDDCLSVVTIGLECRPRCEWQLPRRTDIDGFVDSWYAPDGAPEGCCYGTNLRQFFDGFCYGSQASVWIEVRRAGNLHHLYETIFRNLGDAVGVAVGTTCRLAGESSGLAGTPAYEVSDG